MSEDENGSKRYVTLNELETKLDKLPTRWEVRFLILAAVIATQIVPPASIAQAAIGLVS